jgi:hypothetical protein
MRNFEELLNEMEQRKLAAEGHKSTLNLYNQNSFFPMKAGIRAGNDSNAQLMEQKSGTVFSNR